MNEDTTDASLIDELFGGAVYKAPMPTKKEFLPWHRPRKQLVRDYQWAQQIEKLLPELNLGENRPLRYLGLPGDDLLDIRYFHDTICVKERVKLSFLGFNSGATPESASQVELNISLDEVKRLEFVIDTSNVIADDFRFIGNPDSMAWKQTFAFGPFDVVNLDLCDGFASQSTETFEATLYDAVYALLSIQARNSKPWLLFLTTRVGDSHIHPDVLAKLVAHFRQNMAESEAFLESSSTHFKIVDEKTLDSITQTSNGLADVFLTGLCKWLLASALSQNPGSKVELKSVIGYRVKPTADTLDLVSLALKFVPIHEQAADPLGLAKAPRPRPRESDLAPPMVRTIAKRKDADHLLRSDADCLNTMTEMMATLMKLARYNVDEYRKWVADGCPFEWTGAKHTAAP